MINSDLDFTVKLFPFFGFNAELIFDSPTSATRPSFFFLDVS